MIRVVYHERFLKSAVRLPQPAREKLADLAIIAGENPFDHRLHTKKLGGELAGFYSFRITRDWRVVFQFTGPETVQFLRVGNRKDIYR